MEELERSHSSVVFGTKNGEDVCIDVEGHEFFGEFSIEECRKIAELARDDHVESFTVGGHSFDMSGTFKDSPNIKCTSYSNVTADQFEAAADAVESYKNTAEKLVAEFGGTVYTPSAAYIGDPNAMWSSELDVANVFDYCEENDINIEMMWRASDSERYDEERGQYYINVS